MASPQFLGGTMADFCASTPADPPTSIAPSDQSCVMCSRKGTKTCTNCNHTRYCGVDHQKLDWPVHKLLCKAQKEFFKSPKVGMVRAILFPGGTEKPRFVWWPEKHNFMMLRTLDTDGHTKRFASVGCQFSMFDLMETHTVSRNLIQNRKLNRAILVCRTQLRGGGRHDPNERILDMTRGNASFIWTAATIAFRLDSLCPPHNPSKHFEDIGVDDLRHLADFFTIAYRTESKIIYKSLGDVGQKAMGVKVRCQADMDQDATAKFKAVRISLKDIVFKQPASGITNLLGLPIQVRKFNEDETRSGSVFSNRSIMQLYLDVVSRRALMNSNPASKCEARPFNFLSDEELQKNFGWVTGPKEFIGIDPQVKGFSVPGSSDSAEVTMLDLTMYESKGDIEEGILGFGSPPRTWLRNVGSVIAVRVDGKELLPKHLQVLCDFCEHKMGPLFTKMRQGGSEGASGLTREDVLDEITRAKFMEFFEGYCAEKAVEDESWRGLKSPYDM